MFPEGFLKIYSSPLSRTGEGSGVRGLLKLPRAIDQPVLASHRWPVLPYTRGK